MALLLEGDDRQASRRSLPAAVITVMFRRIASSTAALSEAERAPPRLSEATTGAPGLCALVPMMKSSASITSLLLPTPLSLSTFTEWIVAFLATP